MRFVRFVYIWHVPSAYHHHNVLWGLWFLYVIHWLLFYNNYNCPCCLPPLFTTTDNAPLIKLVTITTGLATLFVPSFHLRKSLELSALEQLTQNHQVYNWSATKCMHKLTNVHRYGGFLQIMCSFHLPLRQCWVYFFFITLECLKDKWGHQNFRYAYWTPTTYHFWSTSFACLILLYISSIYTIFNLTHILLFLTQFSLLSLLHFIFMASFCCAITTIHCCYYH